MKLQLVMRSLKLELTLFGSGVSANEIEVAKRWVDLNCVQAAKNTVVEGRLPSGIAPCLQEPKRRE